MPTKWLALAASLIMLVLSPAAQAGYDITLSASSTDPYVNSGPPVGNFQPMYLWAACGSDGSSPLGLTALEMGLQAVGDPQHIMDIIGFTPAPGVFNVGTGQDLFLAVGTGCAVPTYPRLLGTLIVRDNGGSFDPVPSSNGALAVVDCAVPAATIPARFIGWASHGGCAPAANVAGRCPVPDISPTAAGWDVSFGDPNSGGQGANNTIHALHTMTDGSALIVGGRFSQVGSVAAQRIARWSGSSWSALGAGLGGSNTVERVVAITEFDGSIVAAGQLIGAENNIARWTGSAWEVLGDGTPIGNGLHGPVECLLLAGSRLFAGGNFDRVGVPGGGLLVNGIAYIESGTPTAWHDLAGGVTQGGSHGVVSALASYGGDVIVGGTFDAAGGVAANNVARWDGFDWHPLQDGANGTVRVLTVFQGRLLAAGEFDQVDGQAMKIATWDGSSWRAMSCDVDPGTGFRFDAMGLYDTPTALGRLIAVGDFLHLDQVATTRMARWSREPDWRGLGGGLGVRVVSASYHPRYAVAQFQGSLYVGGNFSTVADGAVQSSHIARWTDPVGADLSVTKTVDNPTPGERSTVIYTVSLSNHGTEHATGVAIADALPEGVAFTSAAASTGSYSTGTDIWSVGNLDFGAHATLQVEATVDDVGSGGTVLVNTASVAASDQSDGNVANNADTATIDVVRVVSAPPTPAAPPAFNLGRPIPNPTEGAMSVRFDLPKANITEVFIVDVSGRRVSTLTTGFRAAGRYTVEWDGRDQTGYDTAPGVYFLRCQSGPFSATRKIVRIREGS